MQTDPTLVVTLLWVSRTVIGVTFLVSGAAKLRDLRGFVAGAVGYQVLPVRVVRPLAHVLPIIEIGLGVALLAGVTPRTTAALALMLVAVFAAAGGQAAFASGSRWRSRPPKCRQSAG